jgi:hypothetical protein
MAKGGDAAAADGETALPAHGGKGLTSSPYAA